MAEKGRGIKNVLHTAEVHGARAITEIVTPTSRRYGGASTRQVTSFVVIEEEVVQFIANLRKWM
jgi:hypothetical protein